MPNYDYKCTGCGHRYEKRQGFDAPSRHPCPLCGQEAKRVLHPPPIVFKGKGWYITDSRKGASATLADSGPDSASMPAPAKDGQSDGAAKEDAKPAPTTPSPSESAAD